MMRGAELSFGLYIDGAFEPVTNPQQRHDRWTDEVIGVVQFGDTGDAIRALDAAEIALEHPLSPPQRALILHRVRDRLETLREEFAQLITAEIGKPIQASRAEVTRALDTLQFCAEETTRLTGEIVPLDATESGEGTLAFTVLESRGIVAAITPFNFPLNLLLHKVGPALAASNSVVLKPSERAPLIACKIVELFHEAGLPPGKLNLVMGDPQSIVDAWQQDPRVNVVTFTGSAKVGWQLKRNAPEKHHVLELGSNTALVVSTSADLVRAADVAVLAGLANSGQACVSLQRIYVHSTVIDDFVRHLSARLEKVSTGDPHNESTVVGPLVSDDEVSRISNWLEEAVNEGAELVIGGTADSKTLRPTLVVRAAEGSKIICQEVFGPVLTVNPVSSLNEAIERVNASEFGLNVGLFTESIAEAMEFARRAHAGTVLINMAPSYRADNMPYGGVKGSGNGREGVKYAMRELSHEKLFILHA